MRRPLHRMASRANPFHYGLVLSSTLDDASGLGDGDSVGEGEGDTRAGNAFAIVLRIFAIVAGVRYAGYALGAKR